jgi:hypothetical protein
MNFLNRLLPYVDIAPIVTVAVLIGLFTVETPASDDWDLVPIINKMTEHQLDWKTLDTPYAGHKMDVFYLIAGGAARLSHWNSYFFRFLDFAALLGAWLAIRPLALRQGRLLEGSIFFWSFCQWAVWLWTFMLSAAIAICCVLWAIRLLQSRRSFHFAGAMLLSLVGTFNHGVGLAAWPAALYLVFRIPRPVWQRFAFGIVLVIACVLFLHHPQGPAQLVRHGSFLHLPEYFLFALGSPVGYVAAGSSILLSLLGLGLLALNVPALRNEVEGTAIVIASLSMIGLVTIARGALPPVYGGMDSRYGTMAALFWVGVILTCNWRGSRAYILYGSVALCLLRDVTRVGVMRLYAANERLSAQAILTNSPQRFILKGAQTSPAQFDADIQLMRKWHYSLFRNE